jgi:hypothetical protein
MSKLLKLIFFSVFSVIKLFFLLTFLPISKSFGDTRNDIGKEKYIYIFGGFPDVRFQGAGLVHPHSESNPASLVLIKSDFKLSFGISDKFKMFSVRGSTPTAAIGFKCLTPKFICSHGSAKIVGLDLSYGFYAKDRIFGVGPFIRFKWGNEFSDVLGERDFIAGIGGIALRIFEESKISVGSIIFSSRNIMKEDIPVGGGIGGSISSITDDFFIFGQIVYFSKFYPSAGLIVALSKWLRFSLGYSSHLIVSGGIGAAGGPFGGDGLYVWIGYSFNKIFLLSIGFIQ